MAAAKPKPHYTFNNDQLDRIGRDNMSLLNRLASVATRKPAVGAPPAAIAAGPAKSSFEINRMKKAREIEEANMRLLKKLQHTKSDISKQMGSGAGASPPRGFTKKAPTSYRAPPAERPAWVDPSSTVLPEREQGGSRSSAAPANRKQFKSADLTDIAMQACREDHLYK